MAQEEWPEGAERNADLDLEPCSILDKKEYRTWQVEATDKILHQISTAG